MPVMRTVARLAGGLALASLVLAAPRLVRASHGGGSTVHSNLQVFILNPLAPAVDTYSLGDLAGPWWVVDSDPAAADKEPLMVVAFESTAIGGPAPIRQSHFALLAHTGGGRFEIRQIETVGPADREIHFLRIFKDGGGMVSALDVYQGLDPEGTLTILNYDFNPGTGTFEPGEVVPPGPLPDPLPAVDPNEMEFGTGGTFTPFEVTTNASIPATSRFVVVAQDLPPDLAVEADPGGGVFSTTVAVIPVATDPAAQIRYTLTFDGSEPPDPDANAPLFGADGTDPGPSPDPILLLPRTFSSTTWRLKLRANVGPEQSPIEEEIYVVGVSVFADSDGDGLPDIWEAANGFDPLLSDADRDTDSDGCSDLDEMRLNPGDPNAPMDPNAVCMETRQVRFSGSVRRPDGIAVAASRVLPISPTGADLISDPNHGLPVDPNDVSLGVVDAHAVTDPNGDFTGARTLGEAHVIVSVTDGAAPRIQLHRFVPDTMWALPPRSFSDPAFFTDPNVASDLAQLLDPNTWFDQYRANLDYNIGVAGLEVDARSSAMLQLIEKEVETLLPGLVLDHTGVPVEIDENRPPLDFPGLEDLDLDEDGELDVDVNHPPLESFPDPNDVDLDADSAFDGFALALGRLRAGLTARRLELMEQVGVPLSLVAAGLQDSAEDPNNTTYAEWVALAEDVFRAAADPACDSFFGTTDEVLTDVLDGQPLDPNGIGGCIAALPPPPPSLIGAIDQRVLPADLPGLVAAVRAAAHATSAIYARVLARGEAAFYERGDALAGALMYRGIVADLVAARAGQAGPLSDIIAGAEEAARAVREARLLAGAGRPRALANLRAGIEVLAAALDAADGDAISLSTLNGRMNGLVYRIDRLAGDPNGLAALEAMAADFLLPDLAPPVVAASPAGPLFTGSVSASLVSDEPATIYYTLDGSDPTPGGGSTLTGTSEVNGVVITEDTTLSWSAADIPWGNASGISRITYLSDADADAVADVSDNCPSDPNPGQQNFDFDALGDACDPDDDNDLFADGADCRPMDASLWAAPGELPITLTLADDETVEWSSLGALAGPATVYDLARGMLSDLRSALPGTQFDGAVCLVDNTPALLLIDADLPALGSGFYYLLRGDNSCGTGIWGRASNGTEQVLMACP